MNALIYVSILLYELAILLNELEINESPNELEMSRIELGISLALLVGRHKVTVTALLLWRSS